jgi:hypothetical protein
MTDPPKAPALGCHGHSVHEAGEQFQVDLETGSSVQVRLAEPGSFVGLRDRSGTIEYLGYQG